MLIHKADRNHAGIQADAPFPAPPPGPQGSTGSRTRSPQPKPTRVASGKFHLGQTRRCEGVVGGGYPSQKDVRSRGSRLRGAESNVGTQNEAHLQLCAPQVFSKGGRPLLRGSAARLAPPTDFQVFSSSQLENSPTVELRKGGRSSF